MNNKYVLIIRKSIKSGYRGKDPRFLSNVRHLEIRQNYLKILELCRFYGKHRQQCLKLLPTAGFRRLFLIYISIF